MDRRAWQATVKRVTKKWLRNGMHTHILHFTLLSISVLNSIVWLWVPLKHFPAATTGKLSPFSFVKLFSYIRSLLHKFGLKTSHYIFFPYHVPSQMSFKNVSSSLHLKQHSGFCSNHSKKSSWTSSILKWLFLLWKSVLFQWLVS